jgi:hypothetical protein
MATGRLASGSIAAGGATQLYRNSTGNSQVITLLASSQVSGKAPKLNVKITSENFTTNTTSTDVVEGTNQTLAAAYPALSAQLVGPTNGTDYGTAETDSGSQIHLSITQKETSDLMGQAWNKGYASTNLPNTQPWGKVSFGGQPMCIGGTSGGTYRYDDADRYYPRQAMNGYDPYYFENPNYFNQKKARGLVHNSDGSTMYHIEDISKMPFSDLKKWYNPYSSAGADHYTNTAPTTDASTFGTVTSRQMTSGYHRRGIVYDIWTGLVHSWHSNGYNAVIWIDEASPATTSNYQGGYSSDGGLWLWSNNAWQGSDPASYDDASHGSVYGTFFDIDNGLAVAHNGSYGSYRRLGFKYYGPWFSGGTMNNKDTRAWNGSTTMNTFGSSSYYHMCRYSGSGHIQKLQWVKYNKNTGKYYVCLWDNSGNALSDPPQMGTSYASESGIFEVDITKVYGHSQGIGNAYNNVMSDTGNANMLTKVGSVPDTVSGFMSKPQQLAETLWTAHCQDGKQYFSNNLYTWAEKSSTYIPDDYQMLNTKGTGTVAYHVAADSQSVVYSFSQTVTNDVYDQAAVAGIIAKGAVTPYEQKAIILSDGDAIYVENEDSTNAISITAMGVDV